MFSTASNNQFQPHDEQAYCGVRTLVFGAAGFIGRWVAEALARQGAELHLVVRDQASATTLFAARGIRGEVISLDVTRADAVAQLIARIKPTITFNLAGYGVDRAEHDEASAYRLNAQLPQIICAAIAATRNARWPGQDLVHVGSALEYGAIGGDLAEDSLAQPTTLYGQTKLAGTESLAQSCHEHGVRGLTARLFTVYGAGEHAGRLLPALLEAAQTGARLSLTDGAQRRDFTYVADVAEGLLRLGLSAAQPGEVINLATGRLRSVRDFVLAAAEALQLPADRLAFGALPTRPEEMQHDAVSINRLRQLLAWAPATEITVGIARTARAAKLNSSPTTRVSSLV